jgi:MAP/microtubule affinity-regulating kinase
VLISKERKIKLIDFGFSTYDSQIHYDFCGTPHYISPEIISKGGYSGQAADIWAVGIMMYKMLVGTFPFKGLNDKILYRKIIRGEYSRCLELS